LRLPFTLPCSLRMFCNHFGFNLTIRFILCFFPQVVFSESRSAPFILFMKDAEKSIVGNGDSHSFKSKLENLPDNVVVIGSHTQNDSRKEKVLYFGLN